MALVLKSRLRLESRDLYIMKKLRGDERKYFRWCSIECNVRMIYYIVFLVQFISLCRMGIFIHSEKHIVTCIVIWNLHDYSVQIRRSDSRTKNSEDLRMNYSSDALHISLGKVGQYDSASQTEGRKAPHWEGVISERHMEDKPGKMFKRWFGRMVSRWTLEAWSTPRVTKLWRSKLITWSP